MNDTRTHIVCIVDRSGSMQPIAADAIGGYNSFLDKQRQLPGEAVVTLVLFDHEYIRVCSAVPINKAPKLDNHSYIPRGTTALLDAIGRSIDDVHKAQQRPDAIAERVIVTILTDGLENASSDYTYEAISGRIAVLRGELNWEFVYLGANQDAIAVASKMSIPPGSSAAFMASKSGLASAYCIMDSQVSNFRMERSRKRNTPSHGKEAEEDGTD